MPVHQLATVACAIIVSRILCSSVLGRLSFYWLDKKNAFFGDLDVLAILIGLPVYAICYIILIHSCSLKCAYLVTPCTICFLLSVSVLTCVLEDTIFSCLIIVLHCIKDLSLFVHYLNLLNLCNFIELWTSLCCVIVLMWVCYLLTYLLTNILEIEIWHIFLQLDEKINIRCPSVVGMSLHRIGRTESWHSHNYAHAQW